MASLWTGFWGRILPAPLLSLSAYGLCNCALGLCGMFAAQSVSPATLLSCGSAAASPCLGQVVQTSGYRKGLGGQRGLQSSQRSPQHHGHS